MYKCPGCQKDLRWVGDGDLLEDGSYSHWECLDCNVDVFFNFPNEGE